MFTIFGATGNTGSVVASELLARGQKVRVVARDAAKVAHLVAKGAELFVGDVTDAASIRDSLAGAAGAYLLIPPDGASREPLPRAERIVQAYVQALSAHPVKHAVLLSSIASQEPKGTGPIVTTHHAERVFGALKTTAFTFLRAGFFMENLLQSAHPMSTDGVLPVFGGAETVLMPMVATHDIGVAAADALLRAPKSTETIELSGPAEYSYADAAREASTILGRPVNAVAFPLEALVPAFTSFGMSPEFAELYREMMGARVAGLLAFDGKGKAVHGTTPLRDVLAKLRG